MTDSKFVAMIPEQCGKVVGLSTCGEEVYIACERAVLRVKDGILSEIRPATAAEALGLDSFPADLRNAPRWLGEQQPKIEAAMREVGLPHHARVELRIETGRSYDAAAHAARYP